MLKVIFLLFIFVSFNVFSSEQCAVFEPEIDGCSDKGVNAFNPTTNFNESCNMHDYCYRTIGKSKTLCDKEFEKDLLLSCNKQYLPTSIECILPDYKDPLTYILFWRVVPGLQCILEFPLYSTCLSETEIYYTLVRFAESAYTGYRNGQEEAINWARGLAKGYSDNTCLVSSTDSKVFDFDVNNVINALYYNILNRPPSENELNDAVNLSNIDGSWEYSVINDIDNPLQSPEQFINRYVHLSSYTLVPPKTRGDREFKSKNHRGARISAKANLRIAQNGKSIQAQVRMKAEEWEYNCNNVSNNLRCDRSAVEELLPHEWKEGHERHDNTTAEGTGNWESVYDAPPGRIIQRIISATESKSCYSDKKNSNIISSSLCYFDNNWKTGTDVFERDSNDLVARYMVIGDTKGNDVTPNAQIDITVFNHDQWSNAIQAFESERFTKIAVFFNPVQIELNDLNMINNSDFKIPSSQVGSSSQFSGLSHFEINKPENQSNEPIPYHGQTGAENWTYWLSTSGYLNTQLLPSPTVTGDSMIEVNTDGGGNGIIQVFAPKDTGYDKVRACVKIHVLEGSVGIGIGNGGDTHTTVWVNSNDHLEQVRLTNGISPANEIILYSNSPEGVHFIVDSVRVIPETLNEDPCLPE